MDKSSSVSGGDAAIGRSDADRVYLDAHAAELAYAKAQEGAARPAEIPDSVLIAEIARLSDEQVARGLGLALGVDEALLPELTTHLYGGRPERPEAIHRAMDSLRRRLPAFEKELLGRRPDLDGNRAYANIRRILRQVVGADLMAARPLDVVIETTVHPEQHAVARSGVGVLTRELLLFTLRHNPGRVVSVFEDLAPTATPAAPARSADSAEVQAA